MCTCSVHVECHGGWRYEVGSVISMLWVKSRGLDKNSLRSWRYCVGAKLKFWRRSRVPKKGSKWDLFPLSLLENVPIAEQGNPRKDRIACPASPRNAIFREITRSTYSDVGTSLPNSIKKKTDNRIAVTTKFHDSTKHL